MFTPDYKKTKASLDLAKKDWKTIAQDFNWFLSVWGRSILFEELDSTKPSFHNVRRDGATDSCFRWQEQQ
jgi:hypothetical protein